MKIKQTKIENDTPTNDPPGAAVPVHKIQEGIMDFVTTHPT
jgi:hypothetical protein